MSEVKDSLLEKLRTVVEGEYNAKESVRTFAYTVLPKLLPTMPDDFVGFLLNVLNIGFNFLFSDRFKYPRLVRVLAPCARQL
jgi:hypothetical protein